MKSAETIVHPRIMKLGYPTTMTKGGKKFYGKIF